MRCLPLAVLLLFVLAGTGVAGPDRPGLRPVPEDAWTRAKAAHLLRRAGFGGAPEEIDRLHAMGLRKAVDHLVDYEESPWPDPPAPGIEVRERPGRALMEGKTRDERRQIQQAWQQRDRQQDRRLDEWWLRRMIRTPRPLEERMTLFWHGHFTSGYRTVRSSYRMYVQNAMFRGLATGSFRALLHEVARDPAMLRYLDGDRNRKGQPNENFAREVMELFTLGEGHYSEADIKDAARAFTGWTVRDGRFSFEERNHDTGSKRVLGRRGRFDGHDVLEILLAQRQTARHIGRSLYRYFVHDEPDEAMVKELGRLLKRHDYELKPFLRTLFLSDVFYDARSVGGLVKSPVDFVVGLFRTLGVDPGAELPLGRLSAVLGQDLFEPPNVKGWDGHRAWITTSHLLNRYNFAVAVVGQMEDRMALAQAGLRARGLEMRARNNKRRGGGRSLPPLYDAQADVFARGLDTPSQIVHHYVDRLLARPMKRDDHEILVSYLRGEGEYEVRSRDGQDRLHGLLRLLVSTPEFQLK